ncbi:MAG: DUF433 domain-containing protein [Blastocatellia bacterium]
MNVMQEPIAPDVSQALVAKATASGLSINDYLRRMLGLKNEQMPGTKTGNRAAIELPKLVKEEIHGEVIEYYPLGDYVVIQPGVQSGLPTIKNTRITAGAILGWLRQGDRPEEIAQGYGIPLAAVQEAIQLAEVYDYERSYA